MQIASVAPLRLSAVTTGKELLRAQGKLSHLVYDVAFSPDGRRLVAGLGSLVPQLEHPGEIRLWDVPTGHEVFRLRGHTSTVVGVAFSPNGKQIATASLTEVKIWDGTPLDED
jgi:WD40 repeat protein